MGRSRGCSVGGHPRRRRGKDRLRRSSGRLTPVLRSVRSFATRKRGAPLLGGLLIFVAVAGTIGALRYRAPASDHAVHLVPPDATTYLHVFLKPSTSQRKALRSFLERFPTTDEEDEAESFVGDVLRDVLGRFDVTVDEDAGEWLGDEVAAYLSPGQALPTMILAVEDEDAARAELIEAMGDRLDRDLTMSFLDGFMLIGTSDAVAASIEAQRGDSLADTSTFSELVDELDEHRIALLFADGTWPELPIDGASAGTLRVTETSVIVDAVTEGDAVWNSLRGFMIAGLTRTRGVMSLDLPAETHGPTLVEDARALLRNAGGSLRGVPGGFRLRPPFPLPPLELRSANGSLTALVGAGTFESTGMPDALEAAGRARLGEGYAPTLAIDLTGLPSSARAPFFGPGAVSLRPPLEQILTVDLGVRDAGSHALARLVLTFSDA